MINQHFFLWRHQFLFFLFTTFFCCHKFFPPFFDTLLRTPQLHLLLPPIKKNGLSLSFSLSLSLSLSISLSSSNLVFLFNYLNFIWSFFNFKIFIETIKLYFKQNLYSKDELVTMFFRTPFFYFSNHFKSFKWSNQKLKKIVLFHLGKAIRRYFA